MGHRLVRVLDDAEAFGLRPISGGVGGEPPPPPPEPPPPPSCPPPPPSPTTEPHLVASPAGATPGSYWVEGAEWHYVASDGAEYASTGTAVTTGATPGAYGVEGENWVYGDASGVKRALVKTSLGANANVAGSYWVDSGAAAGKQWQWLSGSARYEHWNGV